MEMTLLELVQTDVSQKSLEQLAEERIDSKKYKQLIDLSKKDKFLINDITSLEKISSPNVPAFFALNVGFCRIREPDYKASLEFHAKTEKLRNKFADQEYRKLVETVDPSQGYGNTPLVQDFGADMRSMNRQLGTIINFLITVVGGFFFGFTGITYAYPSKEFDLATRFILGLILATIIFFADLYFVIKNMDEELSAKTVRKENSLNLKKLNTAISVNSKKEKEKKNE